MSYAEQWVREAMRQAELGAQTDYLECVLARLAKGEREYPGERAAERRGLAVVVAEAREEAADLSGWLSLGGRIVHTELAAGRLSPARAEAGQEWLLSAASRGVRAWHDLIGAAEALQL